MPKKQERKQDQCNWLRNIKKEFQELKRNILERSSEKVINLRLKVLEKYKPILKDLRKLSENIDVNSLHNIGEVIKSLDEVVNGIKNMIKFFEEDEIKMLHIVDEILKNGNSQVPEDDCQVPEDDCQVPEDDCQIPEDGSQVPEDCCQVPEKSSTSLHVETLMLIYLIGQISERVSKIAEILEKIFDMLEKSENIEKNMLQDVQNILQSLVEYQNTEPKTQKPERKPPGSRTAKHRRRLAWR